MCKGILLCVAYFLLASAANAKDPDLLSLSMEHFRDTATVKNDPLDTQITITTQPGYQERHGLLRTVWNDQFLRGFIDKKTGAVTMQIYSYVSYDGASWRFFQTVDYATDAGPQSATLTVISRDLQGCAAGSCSYQEHVAFQVPEDVLRAQAAKYVPGKKSEVWLWKLDAQDGHEFRDGLTTAEIAGFLAKIDEYVAKAGIKPPA